MMIGAWPRGPPLDSPLGHGTRPRVAVTLQRRVGCMLGFATHF